MPEQSPAGKSADLALSPEEVALFHRQGFLGPFQLCTAGKMCAMAPKLEQVLASQGPALEPCLFRHFDSPLAHELCSHPAVTERIASILGPELLLWHSRFFPKPPGDIEVPWHQDGHYWPLDPVVNVSMWLAIDHATRDNACLQVFPGSHGERIPHVEYQSEGRFRMRADPACLPKAEPLSLEVKPGEFILFDAWLLHASAANHSTKRRLALSVRFTVPGVEIDATRYFAGYRILPIRTGCAAPATAM